MPHGHNRGERGQTLVIVALALIVLLLVAGLAIDGGFLHFNRRRMQNAADAAAVEGTRLLAEAICDPATVTDSDILAATIDYAQRNGVEDANAVQAAYVRFEGDVVVPFDPPVLVGNGTIPQGAAGIAATTAMTQTNYFMGLIGRPTARASADATAVTGRPWVLAGGLLPVGVFYDRIQGQAPDTPLCVINSETWDEEGEGIIVPGIPAPSANRGWLNLDCIFNKDTPPGPRAVQPCAFSNSDINGWIALNPPFMHPIYAGDPGGLDGDWIRGDGGVRAENFGALESTLSGSPTSTFYAPLFDVIYQGSKMEDDLLPVANPSLETDWFQVRGGPTAFWYHIVGFVGFRYYSGGTDPCAGYNNAFAATYTESIVGAGQVSPNAGYGSSDPCREGLMVVTLWE
jgi:hypothetical protein